MTTSQGSNLERASCTSSVFGISFRFLITSLRGQRQLLIIIIMALHNLNIQYIFVPTHRNATHGITYDILFVILPKPNNARYSN